MNERFVAVRTVRGRGYMVALLSREMISESWGMATDGWIEQFGEKNHGRVCRAYLKETKAQHIATSPSMA